MAKLFVHAASRYFIRKTSHMRIAYQSMHIKGLSSFDLNYAQRTRYLLKYFEVTPVLGEACVLTYPHESEVIWAPSSACVKRVIRVTGLA